MALGTFATLIKNGGRDAIMCAMAFQKAIDASRESNPMNHWTQAEEKRRFEICCSIFEKLAGQHKWGLKRSLDHVSGYLKAELNGVSWAPDARTCWMPGDG